MEIGGKPNFPEVAATFNAATNHPLKLAMLGWMALQPEKPQSAAGILEDLNSNQGTYPGYAPPMAKAGQMHEYCTIAFTGAELIEPAGKLPSRSGRDSPAYTVPQESAGGTLAALGACMDWELAYPDETLSHFLGARSSGRGTLTKSGAVTRLAVYDTLLSSGAATSEVLRARTGRDEKAMNGLLRNLRDAGLVSMVRDSYSFDLRHISILGYPSDHAPLHPKEHFELKALYTLLTELYVRKQYQMTGGVLLKALKARHPDIDGKQTAYLLRRRIENNGAWRKFVLLETTTQTPDLHRKQYAAADEAREPMQDLVNRYKEVSEPENWEKWQKRAREILTTPELLAEL
ncbi:MAG TPA: hypothetical protein VLF62_06120, partial [Candidatus Saccharimonadales bacterium]|nr:hypothetical protein [Candidatus Saccharimonadales bacterium]